MALLGRDIAGDDAEQSGLAGAVAADQADTGAGWNTRRGAFQQLSSSNTDREIVNDEHAAPFGRRRGAKQPPEKALSGLNPNTTSGTEQANQ
jgi:hypothetical protein